MTVALGTVALLLLVLGDRLFRPGALPASLLAGVGVLRLSATDLKMRSGLAGVWRPLVTGGGT